MVQIIGQNTASGSEDILAGLGSPGSIDLGASPTVDLGLEYNRRQLQNITANWKLTPATFQHRLSRGQWIAKKHLLYISGRVAAGIAKGNARIIISAPPRHGKSQLTSIGTPAWVLETFPKFKTILTGYGAELTTGFARQVRDVFLTQDNHALLNTRIRKDASRVEAFLTEQGGGMYAVGLGGAITGRGANVLLIDDYIKEIKEALSPAYRDYVWNWFTTTAFTRLEPGGSCIIIATRWHSDDLIGRILTNFPGEWEYIEIPAIAENNDIIGRLPGEALFPERFPLKRLQELQVVLGSSFFQALYQQKPVDETKKMTDGDWLNVINTLPVTDYRTYKWARVWDMAATEDGGDYTVGTLMGYSKKLDHTIIRNVKRDQLSPGGVERLIRATAEHDGTDVEIILEEEPGSAGKALINHFRVNVLPEFTVRSIRTTKNKLVRAQPFIAAAEARTVSILAGAWNTAFVREFDAFPGVNDDQVDTASAGYITLSGKKVFSASWGRNTSQLGVSKPSTRTCSGTENSTAIKQAQFNAAGSVRKGVTFGRRR